MRSYTYELLDDKTLLHAVRRDLEKWEDPWREIATWMPRGHIEYKPIRTNPVRSGYRFAYARAGLDLTVYFPERVFSRLLEVLDAEKTLRLKSAFQAAIPERSGYVVNEFKIRGVLDEPPRDAA